MTSGARAIADLAEGRILATVEIAAPPERVFQALTSDEITRWWGADGIYRTTSWSGDLRVGGRWIATGASADGKVFAVEGEFLEIDPPRKLVQSWKPDWTAAPPTTVTFLLEPIGEGTRVTLRHDGFAGNAGACLDHTSGWEKVLGWLKQHLNPQSASDPRQLFFCRLIPPRPTFAQDMTPEERAVMVEHAAYLTRQQQLGTVIVFGPVADPAGPWGLGILRVASEAAAQEILAKDPAITSGRGLRYEIFAMPRALAPAGV
jgi:uncharacterized protein YndB with AHSA1/START domain